MSKAFIDVLPGEERIIKYSMKQNSGGDGDNGEIGKVDIQIDATCEVVEKDITIAPGEEEPLPEPEPNPEPSPGTKPAITGKDFDITQSITIPPRCLNGQSLSRNCKNSGTGRYPEFRNRNNVQQYRFCKCHFRFGTHRL